MPVTITHHPELRLAISRPRGVVTADEVSAAWGEFYLRHRSLAGYSAVVDHRQVRSYEIDHAQMRSMVRTHVAAVTAGIAPDRIAQFAPRDLSFGMARMFELLATAQVPTDIAVFARMEELAEWLNLPCPTVRQILDAGLPGDPAADGGRPLGLRGNSC